MSEVQKANAGFVGNNLFTPRGEVQEVYIYSRFVSLMKLFLPSVALVIIVLVMVWPHIKPQEYLFEDVISTEIAGQKVETNMVNPKYFGVNEEGRPFSVSADIARKVNLFDEDIDLEIPKADMTLKDGSWIVVTAEKGLYRQSSKSLELIGSVNVFHDRGYEFQTTQTHIDLNTGVISGDAPIEGHAIFGKIEGQGFKILNKSNNIHFTGKASMVIYPGAGNLGNE
jgi:lipopolysaccharide export system protein LptC